MSKTAGVYEQEAESLQSGALGHYAGAGEIGRATGALGGLQSRTYQRQYQPIIQQLPSESNLDDAAIMGQANVDVMGAFDKSKGTMQRDLARMGVSPSSGRWGGLEQKWALARAAAEAGAKTRARRMVREEEWARKLGLGEFGQRMAGQASSTMGAGYNERIGSGEALERQAGLADASAGGAEMTEQDRRMDMQRRLDAMSNRMAETMAGAKANAAAYAGRRSMRGAPMVVPLSAQFGT